MVDAEHPAGRAVADALGAVDLDRWQKLIDRSRPDDITARVERALVSGGQPCRLRVASSIGQEMMVLDGNLLGFGNNEFWVVVDAEGDLWRKAKRLTLQQQPARAALWLADSVAHRIGVPPDERARCLRGLAEDALVERAGGVS